MTLVDFDGLMVGITLVAVSLAIISLLVGLAYFAYRLSDRINSLERGQQAFQEKISEEIQGILRGAPPHSNPGVEMIARRDELFKKLRANIISREEALELNDILLEEKEAAQKRGDVAVLIAAGLGLALLAAVLAKSKK